MHLKNTNKWLKNMIIFLCWLFPFGIGTAIGNPLPDLTEIEKIETDPYGQITQYIIAPEKKHEQIIPFLKETGGVYIGLSTDQNFLLIPHLKPEYIILMDSKISVIATNQLYRYVFSTQKTPDEFIEFFAEKNAQKSLRKLMNHFRDIETQYGPIREFQRYKNRIFKNLQTKKTNWEKNKIKSFLTNQEMYDFMVKMSQSNRYIIVCGDLKGEKTLRSITKHLNKHQLKVSTLALSNAEQSFSYTDAFRNNIQNIPFLDSAIIIRSHQTKDQQNFTYYLQSTSDFILWLQQKQTKDIEDIRKTKVPLHKESVYQLPAPK